MQLARKRPATFFGVTCCLGTGLVAAFAGAQSPPSAEFETAPESPSITTSSQAIGDADEGPPKPDTDDVIGLGTKGGEESHEDADSTAEHGSDPLAPPSPQGMSHERLAAWKGDFEQAKRLLKAGRFAEAAEAFEALSRTARGRTAASMARELAALCAHWNERGAQLVLSPPPAPAPRVAERRARSSGEISGLYVNAAVYGLGTGVWLGLVGEPETASGFFLPTLAVTGAAIGAVALADHGKRLNYGVPQAISSGMYIGFSQGLLWSLAHNAYVPRYTEWSPTTVASVTWASATLGAVTGGLLGQEQGTTPGRAAWVGSTALWGGMLGGLTIAGTVPQDPYGDEKALFGAALLSAGGTAAGILTAGAVSPSLARVRFIDLGGVLGALTGLGLYATAAIDDTKPRGTFWSLNLGAASGLAAAWLLTAGMEPDYGDESQEQVHTGDFPLRALLHARPTVLAAPGGGQLGLAGQW